MNFLQGNFQLNYLYDQGLLCGFVIFSLLFHECEMATKPDT